MQKKRKHSQHTREVIELIRLEIVRIRFGGSFQLTAQELSTILRRDLKPLIFLINNGGYTIERTILGLHAKYNDVANWHYADLPRVFSLSLAKIIAVTMLQQRS